MRYTWEAFITEVFVRVQLITCTSEGALTYMRQGCTEGAAVEGGGCWTCPVEPYIHSPRPHMMIVCFDSTAGTYGMDTPRNGCISCLAGKFNDVLKKTTAGNCKGCPTGQFSTALAVTQASFCNLCGAGYYGDQTGLSAQPGVSGGCIGTYVYDSIIHARLRNDVRMLIRTNW